MKKIKDLIYNFNDIFIAILILALAVAIIAWRVGDIMAYPEYAASKQQQTASQGGVDFSNVDLEQTPVEDFNTEPEDITTQEPVEPQPDESDTQTQEPPKTDTKITIPSGSSGQKIADILTNAGVVPSAQEFLNEVAKQGVEKRLKAGTFTIPAGASIEDIVKILTK